MDVENGFKCGGKLICKVGGIGGWVCVEGKWGCHCDRPYYGRSVVTVLKIEEIFQVISINVKRWEHSLMTWKNLRVLKLWPSVIRRVNGIVGAVFDGSSLGCRADVWKEYGGSQFQNPEVFPSHKTMFSPFYIYAYQHYDLENFFYF